LGFSLDEITNDLNNGVKGKKMNKGMFLMIGVILIVLYVLFRGRKAAPAPIEMETIPDVELAGYPQMNPADLEDTFANYSSVIMGQVESRLEDYQGNLSDFQTDIMEVITENQEDQNRYLEDVKSGLEKQMGTDPATVEKKNSAAWTIGYGLHGDGNPQPAVDFSKNRDALKEEIDRTLSVIAYREKQGLDNTAQNRHLNNLRGT
jgi:hypothetical protein